jgi:6-phosphogluconolactonase
LTGSVHAATAGGGATNSFVYVGSFHRAGRSVGTGVTAFRTRDPRALELIDVYELDGPSFLVATPTHVYAACRGNEFDDRGVGGVVAFRIDPVSGALTLVNQVDVPAQPAHMSIDRTNRFLLVACSFSASIAIVPIRDDGEVSAEVRTIRHPGSSLHEQGLTIDTAFRSPWPGGTPFPHSIYADPWNGALIVPDLGLNRVAVYEFDSTTGGLAADPRWVDGPGLHEPYTYKTDLWRKPLGGGPRHLAFHPSGEAVYVVNELSSSVTTYRYGPDMRLELLADASTLPDGFRGVNSTAEIRVDASGAHLFVSNRGHDSIARFTIQPDLTPRLVGHVSSGGHDPRGFACAPGGEWMLVAHVSSGELTAFELNPGDGELTGLGTLATTVAPSSVVFVDAAR